MIVLLTWLNFHASGAVKSNQRIFVNQKSISAVDSTFDGFRVILDDDFIETHLLPTLLPTLYLTAVSLESKDRTAVTSTIYADSPLSGKQIHISGLRSHAWYYLCVEFENFNRQNETTGSDCEFHRTLQFGAKKVDSTVDSFDLIDVTSQSLAFSVNTSADFERRITFTLRNGRTSLPAAEIFYLDSPANLDLKFSNLKPDKFYGFLCVLEEPLVEAWSAMGRKISGLKREKCHFGKLKTKDYDWSIFESEASPYSSAVSKPITAAAILAIFAHFF
uniref:Uncharacterized protein n=1 Tax=Panagrolaimus sp. JU765 TaxID=591449 RepID=A0AC34R958_9BILA